MCIDKSQIISVQASAGSGKTYSLAKRYLHLLLGSNNNIGVKNIVAVTFTNKAAMEMKLRVINYLKKAALSLDTGDFFDDLNLTKNEIARKSIITLQHILEYYDDFNISTIDSFKNHILKSCAMSIDLSPNFTIEQDYSDNLLFALEIFLQKIQVSKNFRDIISQYLSQYLVKNSDWFPKNNIYNEIEKIFKRSGNSGKDIVSVNNSNFIDIFFLRADIIVKKIKSFAEFLPKLKIDFHYNKAVEKVIKEGTKLFFSMNIPTVFAYETIKYKKDMEFNNMADKLWSEINKEIKLLCDFYMENYYGIYSDIYSKVMFEFDKQSKKDDVVFLNEINKKTVKLFNKNNSIMPEVYYRLSEKYKHFLIDEFQDINLIQWIGIKRFLEENLAEDGTFFYVGDAKQAIYAFRGGRPELFDVVSDEFPSVNIDKRYLKQNFRSCKIIVDFNNNIFSKENIERFLNEFYKDDKDIKCDFSKFIETYSSSRQENIRGHDYGYVEINIIDKKCKNVKEETKQKFINYIFQLLKRFRSKDIAVLCRTNSEIFIISSWLLENGLDVESSQTLNIRNNGIIKQVISLLMFIVSPTETLPFSSFILGNVFSKAADIESTKIEKFIFDCNKKNKTEALYMIFRCKYKNLWNKYFEEFFTKAGFMPVYELTLAIIEKFKIIDHFPDSKAFIMCLLEFIKEFEIKNSGLSNFLESFNLLKDDDDSLQIKNAIGNGIRIMTVHKSKGLQFPVVVIPALKLSERIVDGPYFHNYENKVKLLKISENIAKFSQKAKSIYNQEKLRTLISELNILYVSMTRAEYEFYAIVPPRSGVSNNVISLLLGNNNIILGAKQNYNISTTFDNDIVQDIFAVSYKDIQKYLTNTKSKPPDINNTRKNGIIVRYALSKIISLKDKNISDSINDALRFTKRFFFFEDIVFVKKKLEELFAHKEILNLFMYDKNGIYNEKEIISTSGKSLKIDKLILDSDKIIVVDFKSSDDYDEIKNNSRIRYYVKLISKIYTDKKLYACIVDIEKIQLLHVELPYQKKLVSSDYKFNGNL